MLYDSFTLCLGMKVFRCILDSRLSDFLWSTVVHNCRLKFHLPAVLCSSHVSSLHLLLKFSIQSPFLVVNRFNCVLKLPSLNYCVNLLTFWRKIKKTFGRVRAYLCYTLVICILVMLSIQQNIFFMKFKNEVHRSLLGGSPSQSRC